ncbi:hypothetical protein SAMN05660772_01834 [Pasteurella testudinis DSM 23072]|uniref:Uncharacterized protein n=1 Tax=Pasteurella testudinis DSM 23072 TaxID=1122938 RepID=A0A1W1UJU1_9PAST|nr:hypothetical protein [Pasteurella testudinis]SMB81395.1 hypothetical protein SAMN05660772_01834 [Pasteurella testudinis DSM 23072]SUB51392.1 Uncharacterised protein [Pasteurella testudinis]
MSGGGGGGGAPKTPASEIASKQIELKRYDMAQGYNQQFMPQYVKEARRDLSHITASRANADVMGHAGNTYIGAVNPFAASTATSDSANTRNTAIIRAKGAAETNKIARQDAALRAMNGTVDNASKGLLQQAERETQEAINAQNARAQTSAARMQMVGALASTGLSAYGAYKNGYGVFSKNKQHVTDDWDNPVKRGTYDRIF